MRKKRERGRAGGRKNKPQTATKRMVYFLFSCSIKHARKNRILMEE